MLCCVCLAGCDLFESDKSVGGEYELVSFTTHDGTYNVGDTYNGEKVKAESLRVTIAKESQMVGTDGEFIPFGGIRISSDIDDKLNGSPLITFRRNKSKLTIFIY